MASDTRYDADVHVVWGQALAIEGKTDKEIGAKFGVTERTITNWKARHPEFCEALKLGKEQADATVKKSLFELAQGYRFTTKKTVRKVIAAKGDKPELVEATTTVTETFIPPDKTACIFWLKNRDSKNWRDQPIESNGEDAAEGIAEWLEAATPDAGDVAALFAGMDEGATLQ